MWHLKWMQYWNLVYCSLQTICSLIWRLRNWTTRSVRDRRALAATHEDGPRPKRHFHDFTTHFFGRNSWFGNRSVFSIIRLITCHRSICNTPHNNVSTVVSLPTSALAQTTIGTAACTGGMDKQLWPQQVWHPDGTKIYTGTFTVMISYHELKKCH